MGVGRSDHAELEGVDTDLLLELQSDLDDGPVRWLRFANVPEREDVLDLVPAGLDVRAVVTGELAPNRITGCLAIRRASRAMSASLKALT